MRLPEFNHDDLRFRMATLDDVSNMMTIGLSWTEKQDTEGDTFSREELIKSITNGSLPPVEGANLSNFGLYIIEVCDTPGNNQHVFQVYHPVGILELYKGYPESSTLWIGLLIIDAELRRHHYGSKTVAALKQFSHENNCDSIGIGVSLKNWRGLRFWHSVGFNEITKVTGSEDYSSTAHALIALKQSII